MNYIWDFDGTLYDSYPIMMGALKKTFFELEIPYDESTVYEKIKRDSIRDMILDWELPVPAFDLRYHEYEAQRVMQAKPFSQTEETLKALKERGDKHFILTHRTTEATKDLLERDDLAQWISAIVGSDSGFKRKPDPEAINYLIETYHLPREETVMIGDRKLDVEAGINAGIKTCFYDIDHLDHEVKASYTVHELKEILQISSEDVYNEKVGVQHGTL